MQKKDKSICFSGHRSERLPITNEDMEKLKTQLWEEIDKAIEDGFDTFYVGVCFGFDLLCADVVLKLADTKAIKLIAVVPYENQAKNWTESDREIYYNTLAKCDEVITLNTHYKQGCYHERNRYMVDRSCRLICYHDGSSGGTAYTVKYAEENQLQIINLYGV